MIANSSKHQRMIFGKTDHQFNFSVNDSMELFGITIDKDLTFKQNVSSICKKVNNQFSLMTRFGKPISTETMLRLYRAFIVPHFCYCSMVWHFYSKQDSDKLHLLTSVFFDIFSRILTLSTIIYLKGQELQILRISACKT